MKNSTFGLPLTHYSDTLIHVVIPMSLLFRSAFDRLATSRPLGEQSEPFLAAKRKSDEGRRVYAFDSLALF